jgi:hypothetical protein
LRHSGHRRPRFCSLRTDPSATSYGRVPSPRRRGRRGGRLVDQAPPAQCAARAARVGRPPGPPSNRPRPGGSLGPSARRSNRRARWTSVLSPLVMPLSRSHRRVLDRAAPSSSPESAADREQPADTVHTRRSGDTLLSGTAGDPLSTGVSSGRGRTLRLPTTRRSGAADSRHRASWGRVHGHDGL